MIHNERDGWTSTSRLLVLCLTLLIHSTEAGAQSTGRIKGVVVDVETVQPLPGATVILDGLRIGTSTDSKGGFVLTHLDDGRYTVRVRFVGYRSEDYAVRIENGETVSIRIKLSPRPIGIPGVEVTALRPDLQPEASLAAREVLESNPVDSGEMLRVLPGVEAARRGPVGLDPNVRGLVETEVGAYVDGARKLPAGPLRMDSQVSHFDPTIVDRIQVVKGPYALTWGAGNMGAISVETKDVSPQSGPIHGAIRLALDSNQETVGTNLSAFGAAGRVTYWANGTYRQGNDYKAGDDVTVPGDFRSGEARAKISSTLGNGLKVTLSGGYQDQRDIDFPGRLLDADFFEAVDAAVNVSKVYTESMIRRVDAGVYWHRVEHGMDNDEKPTAEAGTFPNGNPRPPLIIRVDAMMRNIGGRAAVDLAAGRQTEITIGADVYSARRDAERPLFAVTPSGPVVPPFYVSDEVWPDVTITDAGVFASVRQQLSSATVIATGRIDVVQAEAGRVSDAYLTTTGFDLADLDQHEVNLSASLTTSHPVGESMVVAAGVGSAVRTADALERYSDRFPASKSQTSAEFIGDPTLDPERSTQVDIWIEGGSQLWALTVNGFARWMDNYITLAPTEVAPLLPLSPATVFRYANGEATFAGFEAAATVQPTPNLTLGSGAAYLWGNDDSLDEPAIGVYPVKARFSARYSLQGGRYYAEGSMTVVGRQDRVASLRGEQETAGYTLLDVQAHAELMDDVSILVGVRNLTDKFYVNHLNASNPFSGQRIAEPGRALFANINVRF